MVWLDQLKPILLLALAYLIYTTMMERKSLSQFVPYNSFEAPTEMKPKEWQQLNDKFGTLVQLVNTTTFSVAYQLDNMVAALSTVLNNMGIGKFDILSVGSSTPLSLTDVVVQDVNTLAITRFARVDFVVESLNPFVIQKVVISPDKQFTSSQNIVARDILVPNMFRIKNDMHLFSPYKTSDDDMKLTETDVKLFESTMTEKANQMVKMATGNAVPAGSVVSLPAMSLPTASMIDKQVVGAGPLRSIGL
jgi:hypothetical protein